MENFKDINLTLPTGCDNAPRKKSNHRSNVGLYGK